MVFAEFLKLTATEGNFHADNIIKGTLVNIIPILPGPPLVVNKLLTHWVIKKKG